MKKRLSVVVVGTGSIRDVVIGPSTEPRQIVEALGLVGYVISAERDESCFAEGEEIFGKVQEGGYLFAFPLHQSA